MLLPLAPKPCNQLSLLLGQIAGCFQETEVGRLLAKGLKDLLYSLIQCPLLIRRSRILGQEA